MLTQIADGLWSVEAPVRMSPGVVFPARMTVLRADDGSIVLYSPLAIDDGVAGAIEALGPVRHIIAPNVFHHLFFGPAAARFPEARTHGPSGLARKRPDLVFDRTLNADADAEPVAPGIVTRYVQGTGAQETALLHAPSRTLVVADLVFNIHETDTWVSSLLFRMLGVTGRVRQSPMWRAATKDRERAAASCEALLAMDWDRLVMSHGLVVETDARQQARDGLSWMLGA